MGATYINQFINWTAIYIASIFGSLFCYYGYYIYKSYALMRDIENKTNSKLIYIKNWEVSLINKILGCIYNNYVISINDNNSLRRILQNNSNKKIIILLESIGGYISSSDSMLNLLDNHKPTKTVYVPTYAMSAATLLFLACDNIYINKYAAIGPTDPQITVYNEMVSYKAVSKLLETKPIEKIKDKILITYYENKVLYDDNINYVKKYINKHKKKNVSENKVNELINMLSAGDIAHHSEISPGSLTKIININNTIPENILSIHKLLNFIFNII